MLRIGLCLLIIPGLVLLFIFFRELMWVDDCLASGGSWNYIKAVCDSSQQHPFVPLMTRKPLLVNGGMLLSCLGLLITIAGLYRRRS
ncbi:hypothetical protein DN062_09895 [Nitrincola tibetensis]|uniref:Uncharacterized protein n=1 Tax=Nitrincola tibetensis TaxID=2219697 RepID=A0A364NM28_9GAMM|nr:hypothetical protein [Nitrincola tibetensis]RAU18084.1 hypothetical protein DN062_09895 [Nitrincola tibetensis]